ncbi:Ribosomal-protein-alanine acetyltransferase [Paraglaciecola mesophila]|uniref:[Ribosomal protein bS18]-alanine N-acetyltransferase n=1 Tax=Paraglaciecola mesophila TaxID=197222 RepID=A0A857JKF9_9ALTE|nr:Ribosomal-protein-alanine acetyltransferase [Paraglaciecola mesophila]
MILNVLKLNAQNYYQAYSIHCNGHSHPWSESVFADCFTDNYQAYALQQDNTVVGLYVALFVLDEATLMDIGVDASYRGRGLSRVLMSHFLAQCKASNIHYVWLEVRASNFAAIGLYEAFGFEQIERRKGYYKTQEGQEDALMMRLALGATE